MLSFHRVLHIFMRERISFKPSELFYGIPIRIQHRECTIIKDINSSTENKLSRCRNCCLFIHLIGNDIRVCVGSFGFVT